ALQFRPCTAEFEPRAALNQPILPPPACQEWMRVPEPEPVFSFVRAAAAGAVGASIAAHAPEVAVLATAATHIPSVARFHAVPQAEPVMAGVWPRVAAIPFEPIRNATPVRLPDLAALYQQAGAPLQIPAAQM